MLKAQHSLIVLKVPLNVISQYPNIKTNFLPTIRRISWRRD